LKEILANIYFQIFGQVVLISLVNDLAASIYVYMQFLYTPEWLIAVGQVLWSQAHGFYFFLFIKSLISLPIILF
jgi:hypothetical protein